MSAYDCLNELVNLGAEKEAVKLKQIIDAMEGAGPQQTDTEGKKFSGTGWFVDSATIITCYHVVEGCTNLSVTSVAIPQTRVRLVAKDKVNDLAILRITDSKVYGKALPLAVNAVQAGESVFTIGYPQIQIMGRKPKFTDGRISATTGFQDDPRVIQMSVPVQAGNSGGPLLNKRGEVVAVVASKLAAPQVFQWTGDLPQNVNYAVKVDYLKPLLKTLPETKSNSSTLEPKELPFEDLAKLVEPCVVLVIAE